MSTWTQRLNPRASRSWRMLLVGVVWTSVGLLLVSMGSTWLAGASLAVALGIGLSSGVVAVLAARFGLSRAAARNLRRLREGPERACLFGFQPLRSWALVAVMITLGATLRHSSLPRLWLAPVYLSMGGALLLSTPAQYREAWRARGPGPR